MGKNALRCQWQIKQGVLGAAVDKIEELRKPDDFIGHRKPAVKPRMLQVRVLSLGPKSHCLEGNGFLHSFLLLGKTNPKGVVLWTSKNL